MIADANTTATNTGSVPARPEIAPATDPETPPEIRQSPSTEGRSLRQMPGLIAVSIYMVILAGIDVVYVVQQRIGPMYLVFSAFFVASAFGLLLFLRWAWSLALAAVALLSALFLRTYFTDQSYSALEQGLVNLIIFLYLVRTNLREKLR